MSVSPSPDAETAAPFRAGLSVPLDILIAPARAFAGVAATGAWIVPYTVLVTLGLLAGFLQWPAIAHLAATLPDADGHVVHGTAAIAETRRTVLENVLVNEALTPAILMALTASVLTLVARFKANKTGYAVFAALAGACLLPSALGELLWAIAVRAHDPASFTSYRDLFMAFPDSLGVFAAKGNVPELLFLARFTIFDVWSYALLAFGIVAFVPVRFVTAVVVAFGLDFVLSFIG